VSCITTSTLVLYCSATTFGPVGHVAVVGRRASVAERLERLERQIGGVHPQDAVVVRQERRGEHVEGQVVDRRRELDALGPLACLVGPGTRVRAEPHGEKEGPVHTPRHAGRVLRAGQVEPGAEVGRKS
jgi:hypothetical protein